MTKLWLFLLVFVLAGSGCGGGSNDNDAEDPPANDDDVASDDDDDDSPDPNAWVIDDGADCSLACPPGTIPDLFLCDCIAVAPYCDQPQPNAMTLELPAVFVFNDLLGGDIVKPAGVGMLLAGFLQDTEIPPLLIEFGEVRSDGWMSVRGALGQMENGNVIQDPSQPAFTVPRPADFSCNPVFAFLLQEYCLGMGEVGGDEGAGEICLQHLELGGRVLADGSGTEDTYLLASIDTVPLIELLGTDPCGLLPGLCTPEGILEIEIQNLTAQRVSDLELE